MSIAILFPRFDHPAIEERYASWQSELALRSPEITILHYDPDAPLRRAADDVEEEYVLVVTDPLLLGSPHLPQRLVDVLRATDAQAVLPVANESANAAQRHHPATPYATLRELEESIAAMAGEPGSPIAVTWDGSDPGAFLIRRETLDSLKDVASRALAGRRVVISSNDFVHRWSSMRGQARQDLLDRIGRDAKSILEFGCGEGSLGEALKRRQTCRVVGIEMDRAAANVARRRIDDVYCGDVREIVAILGEQFDWIVGGDIVEHLDEPWSFLSELRRITKPGGHLLLSLPNLAHASVIADLLSGRFDYVYMGLTCVGHLRFFTRRSIEGMLEMTGWRRVSIEPQALGMSTQGHDLIEKLTAAGLPFSREDLTASGYYVIAQKS